jgi:hypothetical protein
MPSNSLIPWFAALAGAWAAVGCLEKHELFQDVSGSGGVLPASAGASGAGGLAGVGLVAGGGAGGQPPRAQVGDACVTDSDCVSGAWCGDGTCTACAPKASCRAGFTSVKRNGCDACAPPNECTTDLNCGEEMKCFAGQQCDPGCDGSPSCCHGNICGDAECGPPVDLDCSVVGCSDWGSCVGTAQVEKCDCEDEAFRCELTGGANQCEQSP